MSTIKATNLVSISELSDEEVWELIELSWRLKADLRSGRPHLFLEEKTLAMIFLKPSLRTRVSFEVGITQLGGHTIYLGPDDIKKLGERETTEDIAMVLSRFADGIMARVFEHKTIEDLTHFATIPVINGLPDLLHPCQALGDLLTIYEKKRKLQNLKLAFIGDGNNVAHSLINACSLTGMDFIIACPKGCEPDGFNIRKAKKKASTIEVVHEPSEAASGSDVLYTDVWVSMGEEDLAGEKKSSFEGFTIDENLLTLANKEAIVMHCLPAHYGEEITKSVAHGSQSVIFDQAENRTHVQKALLSLLLS